VRRDCVGRRKKVSDGSSVEVTAHIYAPDNAKNDVERVKADIRQRAVDTVEWPRQIILQTTTGTSLEAVNRKRGSGGRERLIVFDEISEQFNNFIVYGV